MDAKLEMLRHQELINETMTTKYESQIYDRTSKENPPLKPSLIHLNANAFENSRESHTNYYEFAQKLIRTFDLEDSLEFFVILLNIDQNMDFD